MQFDLLYVYTKQLKEQRATRDLSSSSNSSGGALAMILSCLSSLRTSTIYIRFCIRTYTWQMVGFDVMCVCLQMYLNVCCVCVCGENSCKSGHIKNFAS